MAMCYGEILNKRELAVLCRQHAHNNKVTGDLLRVLVTRELKEEIDKLEMAYVAIELDNAFNQQV